MRSRTKGFRWGRCAGFVSAFVAALGWCGTSAAGDFVKMAPATSPEGYLARLLINENPFPGERGYVSVEDSKTGMLQVLWVLHGRIHLIPSGYSQSQIASSRSKDILDIITAKNQCEGFSRDAKGKPVFASRVEDRLRYLTKIANSGGKPGKFADLLNFGQGLATAYFKDGMKGADKFAGVARVSSVVVTGRAYSWMTDKDCYNPGGNFVAIPDAQGGSPGGNRYFTLRKEPK
jgi:hypothetical protein